MNSAIGHQPDQAAQIDHVSRQLLPRAALLCRLLGRELRGALSRSEAGVLNTLSGGARRITELAELEGLAQPTTTLLVKRLEQQGLVTRDRQTADGRVVMVSLTTAGTAALEDLAAQASVPLRQYLADSSAENIAALAAATETLGELVALLQDPAR